MNLAVTHFQNKQDDLPSANLLKFSSWAQLFYFILMGPIHIGEFVYLMQQWSIKVHFYVDKKKSPSFSRESHVG